MLNIVHNHKNAIHIASNHNFSDSHYVFMLSLL